MEINIEREKSSLPRPLKVLLVMFVILLLWSLVIIIKFRIQEGCWDTIQNKYIETEYFIMEDYSCNGLREMILLEIYPGELKERTHYYLCNGDPETYKEKEQISEKNFGAGDFKQQYKNKCLMKEIKE